MVGHIAAGGQLHAEGVGNVILTAGKACGDERQLALVGEFFARGHHVGAAGLRVALRLQVADDSPGQVAGLVLQKLLDGGLIDPGIFAELCHALGLAVVHLQHPGPLRPRVGGGALLGRLGHHFQCHKVGAALPQGCALAVVAGVAAADDQHVFALSFDGLAVGKLRVQQTLRHAGQVVHRKVHAVCVPAGHIQVAGFLGTAAQHHSVVAVQQLFCRHGPADVHIGAELHALGLHDLNAALDDRFVQLHVGDAVHQQAAHAVGTLEHSHRVAALIQVFGHRKARGAAAHHGYALAGAGGRRCGVQPALGVGRLNDGVLILAHGHAAAGHVPAGAGGLAQGGAHPAGEFRKTVGGHQPVHGQLPLAVIDQIVPLRDEVVQRAAGGHAADHHARLAEGNTAVHAARRLGLLLLAGEPDVKFVEIFHALQRRHIRAGLARIIDKSCCLTHNAALLTCSSARRRMLQSGPVRRPDRALPRMRSPAAYGRNRRAELS